jgi:pimeloyl-ACP methyl ester carboxylesterase
MVEFQRIQTNGVTLHVALAGPPDGPPVILLHGFPEFWYGWSKQIGPLAAAGYRVIAPDQRGYNLSDKPRGISAYRLATLAADITGLMDALGYERTAVAGHDWGAFVAWWLALNSSEHVSRLVILNVPHPSVAFTQALRHPAQFIRSLYILFFQLPRLPEATLSRNHFQPLVNAMRRSGRPGAFSDADMQAYVEAWSQPGALTHMLDWYRALARRRPKLPPHERVVMPALMIWGVHDPALGRFLAEPSINLCNHGRLIFVEQATHWVQHEEPALVNAHLINFLA